MNILIFKTNIKYNKDLKIVSLLLNQELTVINWNVDMQDIDKILRIESTENNPKTIINLFKQSGYNCEELPD